ncbi:uncharacterized protein C19orf47 homolog isoform X3 [Orcinus orca]|uniref:uncharacterized protein C19orf47 homolog isoform X3 n=1 Tax=Orcinus orca TaxID=9733 RepID=UPI002111AB77|nr:uncharacterized protein C19orf47 homolog isoform X3 [Orcinus orca]
MNGYLWLRSWAGGVFFSVPLLFQPETCEVCGNGDVDFCCPWALSEAGVIVVVTALPQADFLPAAPGYSWAVSPQPRNSPLAGRQAAREGRTLSRRRLMGALPLFSHAGFREQSEGEGDNGLCNYGCTTNETIPIDLVLNLRECSRAVRSFVSGFCCSAQCLSHLWCSTSEWIQFFKEAGIPPGPAVNYAVMFVDNRIQKSMLLDLNKEIMNELGVTVVGDIIAILKHAKVVHRQDMCKAATESVPCSPSPLPGEIRRGASSAASRMITNSLNRDSPPGTPPRRPDTSTSKISVTVSNKMAAKSAKAAAALARQEEESLTGPTKRRRVTAEMEGKYIINMPKGTTARTRKILEQQQAAKGLHRTSVFDRLGAETKADTTMGNKPTGVFSRLGATPETDEDLAWDSDNDSSSSVLQYAGVLKKLGRAPAKASPQPALTVKAKATSSVATAAAPTLRRLAFSSRPGLERKPESLSKVSIVQRLGKAALVPEAQDSQVTSTKSPTVRCVLPDPPAPPASQRPPRRRRWRRACRDC